MQKPRNMQIISRNTREAELLYRHNKIADQFWGFGGYLSGFCVHLFQNCVYLLSPTTGYGIIHSIGQEGAKSYGSRAYTKSAEQRAC